MSTQVSNISILCMIFSAIICFILPCFIFFYLKLKRKADFLPFFLGVATFILSALILEQLLHMFVLAGDNAISNFVNRTPWLYVLYSCTTAGLFEETGRYLSLSVLSDKYKRPQNAIAFGLGHGGMEAIIVGGISILSVLILSTTLNSMGQDAYLALLPVESQETIRPMLENLYTTPSYYYLITGIERIFAMIFHVCMSLLVYTASTQNQMKYLYPTAILLHTLLNVPAALYQKEIFTNIFLVEGYIIVFTLCVAVYTYKLIAKPLKK